MKKVILVIFFMIFAILSEDLISNLSARPGEEVATAVLQEVGFVLHQVAPHSTLPGVEEVRWISEPDSSSFL